MLVYECCDDSSTCSICEAAPKNLSTTSLVIIWGIVLLSGAVISVAVFNLIFDFFFG